MGNSTSKANKEFQAVIPYTPSSKPHPKRKKNATQPRRPTVAPALLKENSGISVDSEEDYSNASLTTPKHIPLRSPSICSDVGWTPIESNFDFNNTEGQSRRELIASCDAECSMITPFLFVGGFTVANSKEILKQHKITRIINCALSAVDSVFESEPEFTYLSLDMLDGRQDDISWYLCEVINFIEIARKDKCGVLLHCQKGISRSCSFAIAYIMWASGCHWKVAFDYVKERRKSCSPNTGFTCNLIEIDELLRGDFRQAPLMFRLSQHLPHDKYTPVLKLIRNSDSRNLIRPHFAYLSSDGIFVIRPSQTGINQISILYIWRGRNTSDDALKEACKLAEMFLGIFSFAANIEIVAEGSEGDEFRNYVEANNSMTIIDYDDLYEVDSCNPVEHKYHTASRTTVTSWANEMKSPSKIQVNDSIRGNILHGVDKFEKNPSVILTEASTSTFPLLSIPEFKMITSKVTPTSTPDHAGPKQRFDKEDEVSGPSVAALLSTPQKRVVERDGEGHEVGGGGGGEGGANARDESREQIVIQSAAKQVLLSVGLQIPKEISKGNQNDVDNELKVVAAADTSITTNKASVGRTKPVLFQCAASPDGTLGWQHMGVYDDDDLVDEYFLFLLCPDPPHHLWKGSSCVINQLAVANSVAKFETVCDDDAEKVKNEEGIDKTETGEGDGEEDACAAGGDDGDGTGVILQYARKNVDVGEVPLASEELQSLFLSVDLVQVHHQNSEAEEWWDAFNNGM